MSTLDNRQIILDTETTGINTMGIHYEGHRIIEIAAVEIINRKITGNSFHTYVNPNRSVDSEAFHIHGISDKFLADKPTFSEIADKFIKYIKGTELIIHNASFDIGFINNEFTILNLAVGKIENLCKIIDSLILARKIFPGKRNSLDALCSRYKIDNKQRELHGALIDAKILAKVYLAMTSGQTLIDFSSHNELNSFTNNNKTIIPQLSSLIVIKANEKELLAHESQLDIITQSSGNCLWRK
ncbi:DNA polymerase III subunit epsilon [Candidatus Ishikawella capsulata]|uniref:DNA polymerase III subunit epsilon n=1 Tax=Candidatus Ishikawaella capsulata Mpkobe TaxID=476281 RepID=C5WDF9_9ENTR|nr:DNA polymerase III subunit epsilon [Candidatus Ishikawaella capsulata]BAH83365.1 DNA polymerase III subunit epsilon [Candidatus Ishikawaella capsulata Mpkobe]